MGEITAAGMTEACDRLDEFTDVFMGPTTAEPEDLEEKWAWFRDELREQATGERQAELGSRIATLRDSLGLFGEAMRVIWNRLEGQRSTNVAGRRSQGGRDPVRTHQDDRAR
jgi:hypothetical protein